MQRYMRMNHPPARSLREGARPGSRRRTASRCRLVRTVWGRHPSLKRVSRMSHPALMVHAQLAGPSGLRCAYLFRCQPWAPGDPGTCSLSNRCAQFTPAGAPGPRRRRRPVALAGADRARADRPQDPGRAPRSAHPSGLPTGGPDLRQLDALARPRGVPDLAVAGVDADVVGAAAGHEEDEVARPEAGLGDVDRPQALGVGGARQRDVQPLLVDVVDEPGAVEGRRARAAPAIGLALLGGRDPDGLEPA